MCIRDRFLIIVLILKPAQRRAWQDVSNKSSNLNAYLHESLDGMKITQAFTREEKNAEIYNTLNTKMYKSWMKAQYTSNLVWVSVDNISTWVVGEMCIRDSLCFVDLFPIITRILSCFKRLCLL